MVPEEWKQKLLGDLFEFKNGLNTDKKKYGDGCKFVNVMDVFANNVFRQRDIAGSVQVTDKQFSDYKIKFGDVFFNRTSETFDEIAMAAVYMDSEPAVFGGFVIRARPTSNSCLPEYLSYAFQGNPFRKQVIKLGQGAVRSNIGQKDLAQVSLTVPPHVEQRKIAQVLSTWDKAIDRTENLLANSYQRKKALMQRLLTGKQRLPDDSGIRFSGKWKTIRLQQVLIEEKSRNRDISITRVLSVTNHSGFVLPEEQFSKRVASSNVTNYRVVKKGQFAYNPSRLNVGSFARLESYDAGILSPMYVVFSVDTDMLESDYFLYWMQSHEARQRINNSTQGSVRDSVSFDALCSFAFNFPPKEEQQKIVKVLSAADKEIDLLQQKLDYLKHEKKALMQQLLTGKRRVKIAEAA